MAETLPFSPRPPPWRDCIPYIPGGCFSLKEAAAPRGFKALVLPSCFWTHNSYEPSKGMFIQLVP